MSIIKSGSFALCLLFFFAPTILYGAEITATKPAVSSPTQPSQQAITKPASRSVTIGPVQKTPLPLTIICGTMSKFAPTRGKLAFDNEGNLFVAPDSYDDKLDKIDMNGTVTKLLDKEAVADFAIDLQGNIFIAGGPQVSMLSPQGVMTTVPNSIGGGAIAVKTAMPSEIIYVASGNSIYKMSLVSPPSIFVDIPDASRMGSMVFDGQGNLYVTDQYYIRKIDPLGNVTKIAGNGQWAFSEDGGEAKLASVWWPWDITVDSAGNLYFADFGNNRIRKIDTQGIIQTVAGGGTQDPSSGQNILAKDAALFHPSGVAIDKDGNLFFSNGDGAPPYRVYKVSCIAAPSNS